MKIKKIGIFTSGGDAPGMNACLRSVVRTAIHRGLEVMGIRHGYNGMVDGDLVPLDKRSVSNISPLGGTILHTGRSKEFMKKPGRRKAAMVLERANIDALIAIGGDGTFHGAHALWREWKIPAIGVPGTIDNDLYGTDYTIGFDTAVDTALRAIDKIRDTAVAHDRTFLVEVMGRHAGFLGLKVGAAAGVEEILIPEIPTDVKAICKRLRKGKKQGKTSHIMVVAEGDEVGGAIQLGKEIQRRTNLDFRVSILGYIQRGGNPTANDRILATKLGYEAVRALLQGKHNCMVGEVRDRIRFTPLKETWTKKKPIDKKLLRLTEIISQ